MIPHKTPYQNASVFPLFSQNREKSKVETSRLLTKNGKEIIPVVMRYTIDRKSWYNFVAGEFTEEDFAKVCNSGQGCPLRTLR